MGRELGWGRREVRRATDAWRDTLAVERLVGGEPLRA
jgi:hypothetical protein